MLPVWMPFNEVKKRHEDIVAYNERVKDDIEKNEALEKQRLESEVNIKEAIFQKGETNFISLNFKNQIREINEF